MASGQADLRRRRAAAGKDVGLEGSLLEEDSKKEKQSSLGFLHWILLFVCLGVVCHVVNHFDSKMPPVERKDVWEKFSEERARKLTEELSLLGPRPSGSKKLEIDAVNLLLGRIHDIQSAAEKNDVNRLEMDTQRPSDCFDVDFISPFTICYHKLTNIGVRIGPKEGPTKHSFLVNCHFDSQIDAPGATDDAVSCAIMMDVLDVLAHGSEKLNNDIVFLFNGAEESCLQGAHGFIKQHPWRHSVRAFLNLEGAGAGGRETLFQAGPGNDWLLDTYIKAAPHPSCSVMAQEIFQAKLIPSDTDFRIFRDFGRISGLDIAYNKNGWVYHTEFDEHFRIEKGAIQRAGDNVLAIVKAIDVSPYLAQPSSFEEKSRWVFFDVLGLFTIQYATSVGFILNICACTLVALRIYASEKYSPADIVPAFGRHLAVLLAMISTTIAIVSLVILLKIPMFWYKGAWLMFPIYAAPALLAGVAVHSIFVDERKRSKLEAVHHDSLLISLALVLALLTFKGSATGSYVLIFVFLSLAKVPIEGLLPFNGPSAVFIAQLVSQIPVWLLFSYVSKLFIDVFVPIMGRFGAAVNPDYVIGGMAMIITFIFLLTVNNLIYITRRLNRFLLFGVLIYTVFFLFVASTELGVSYKYEKEIPKLRRIFATHTDRKIFSFDGSLLSHETGIALQGLDIRNSQQLPRDDMFKGKLVDCSGIADDLCALPYIVPKQRLFKPTDTLWLPTPEITFPRPLELKMIDRQLVGENKLNYTFELRGGSSKMALHVTPLDGYDLSEWSFSTETRNVIKRLKSYFVMLTHGAEAPEYRRFWILLKNEKSTVRDPSSAVNMELTVAAQQVHGEHQNTPQLTHLRKRIAEERVKEDSDWRWRMTVVGGTAQIQLHRF